MCKKILRGSRQYQLETNCLLVLKYYMIEKPVNSYETYYGVEINRQKIGIDTEDSINYKRLLLSECKGWVEELIDKMIGNGVTPATMEYIIDDIMGIPC